MRRIGLTQRVEYVEPHGERRDCLDQRWAPLLEQLGLLAIPLANTIEDVVGYLGALALDGIILSGGNDLSSFPKSSKPAPERDRFERLALDYARAAGLPALGVCRGMQLMGDYYGGRLTPLEEHVAQRHEVRLQQEFLSWPPSLDVNSYHNYGFALEDLPGQFNVIALAADNTVEAFQHEAIPHYGIMWHPEREPKILAQDAALLKHLFS
ncbi:MAG: gamma-glutamyl-gamma-aminobutyrate hydrolase family protein [Anaerolineales bacterium]|nr:gamma-glutamyl-gamma-aminobutyrate hydrolase family protein [Anaerolineales bacterium]